MTSPVPLSAILSSWRLHMTFGPVHWVRNPVTEVTFSTMLSAVQLVADVPDKGAGTFPLNPCFNGNGNLPRVNRVEDSSSPPGFVRRGALRVHLISEFILR